MIPDADKFDAIGRSRTKTCPSCQGQIGRTLQHCTCGHEFVGKGMARKLRNGEPVKRGRPAKFDLDAPEPEAQLLALVEPKMQIPHAARFVVSRTPEGGLQLSWPDFGVTFTLSPGERMILRSIA